ncbi:MAG: hypothetical protein HFH40_00215 [Lachnospiraceae bacterium]|jgi:DMSO reductase anchor subunit|nr:hypothetical protein [Lachnospiraceae bacterium]
MDAKEKKRLSKEAQMQLSALKTINKWKTLALALSAIGVALTYAGMAGTARNLPLGILGIAAILIGAVCAIILNLGLRNGRRNVEKMLDAIGRT